MRCPAFFKLIVLICTITFSASPRLLAQISSLRFERLTIDRGLSQNFVACIAQDRKGFLWFGTRDGLNRYDGYQFKIYSHNALDSTSLSANDIWAIHEDRQGNLWVGTGAGGLNKYDLANDTFIRYQHDPEDPHSLSHNDVQALLEDRRGALWIGTAGGLNRFDPKTESFTRFIYKPDDSAGTSPNIIQAIFEAHDGNLWLGVRHGSNGLLFFDRATESFTAFAPDPAHPEWSGAIKTLYMDKSGNLWAGAFAGLFRIKLEEWQSGRTPPNSENLRRSEQDWMLKVSEYPGEINAICQDEAGKLWLGSSTSGLFIYDIDRDEINEVAEDALNPHGRSGGGITTLFRDRSDLMWLGTNGNGLSKLNRAQQRLGGLGHDPKNTNSLSNASLRAICEDNDGNLWIGGYGGLDHFDRKTGRFTHYLRKNRQATGFGGETVWAIYEDPLSAGERLWLGTEGGGLYRLNRKNKKFIQYKKVPGDPLSLNDNFVFSIYRDRTGTLWVGTEAGLNKFDELSKTFKQYNYSAENTGAPSGPPFSNVISGGFVQSICESQFGDRRVLWLTTENGLNCFDLETEQFVHFLHGPANRNSFSQNNVNCVYQDRSGRLWLGTSGGLSQLILPKASNSHLPSLQDATFVHYTEIDGLPNNFIYGILEDEEGQLWLSTNKGISRFNPETKTFRNYDIRDGLQSLEFNRGAYYRCRHGEMFFGGIAGLNFFFPEFFKDNPHRPNVVITDFKLFNESVAPGKEEDSPLKKQITVADEIQLSYEDRVFSFEFAALEFTAPEKNQYAYKMEGFQADWVQARTKRAATYTNLDPGEYTFRVKGSNNDGVWNEEGTSLRLVIAPPWWQTWWFRIAGLAAAIFLIIAGHQFRIRNIAGRNRLLRAEIDRRKQTEEKLQTAFAEISQLKERLEAENVYLRQEVKLEQTFGEITGLSEAIKKMVSDLGQVVSTDATVLLLGETGTGKELFANAIHNHGARKGKMMIKVNCASLPAALIESELFGREKGAYTGAMTRQAGRFEIAHGSTIFLDEIGELPLELQPKLLRVLQAGEFERLGSPKTVKVDVRVIAATNRDLAEEVRQGNFREDLYYRLNVFPIKVPPLRERAEDIPVLVWVFIDELGQKMGKKIQSVPKKTMEELQRYHWPGNIRQLRNVIEHAMIISNGKTLQIQLPEQSSASLKPDAETLEEIEFKYITQVLKKTNWRIKGQDGAAAVLGLNPGTLYSRMKKLGIPTNREKGEVSAKN